MIKNIILVVSTLLLMIGLGLCGYATSIMAVWSITSADIATMPMLRAGVMGQCGVLIFIPGGLLMALWFFLKYRDKIL
jgi:hypothetical protein